jgi:Zn-dependent M28 family amino/carboxypeptidase
MKLFSFFFFLFFLLACGNSDTQREDDAQDTTVNNYTPVNRFFNSDSAYHFVEKQVGFGPRVPGTKEHLECFDFLLSKLKTYSDTVYVQRASAMTFDKKNIPIFNLIGTFNPDAKKRVLLCAHWDTRPFADQDTANKDKPILGANDGASGVAVLLEIANQLKQQPLEYGIDIVLFDAEDWGDNSGAAEDSYCLGSQYWGKNPHVKNYKANFGILLDMVGAPNANFGFEGYSLAKAQPYVSMVWNKAAELGFGRYFKNFQRGYITDDHYYIMKHTGIPTIDIIDYDGSTRSNFGKYWHTHSDNMDAIDKNTLKAVGQTILGVLESYSR